ncbi:MAG: hypothetical protein AAGA85_10260 [Bacteroidota bacterium]
MILPHAIIVLLTLGITPILSAQAPTILISGQHQFKKIEDFVPDPNVEGAYQRFESTVDMSLYLEGVEKPYKVRNANINLLDHSVLLGQGGSTVFIRSAYVDSLSTSQLRLVHAKHLSPTAADLLLQPLQHGAKVSLYKEVKMELLPPTYNESLQIGNKNYTLERYITFYILDPKSMLLPISKNLKAFKNKPYFGALKKFVKSEKIDFDNEQHMLQIAAFLEKGE